MLEFTIDLFGDVTRLTVERCHDARMYFGHSMIRARIGRTLWGQLLVDADQQMPALGRIVHLAGMTISPDDALPNNVVRFEPITWNCVHCHNTLFPESNAYGCKVSPTGKHETDETHDVTVTAL